MSLTIDINRILPVKICGVSPNLLSRSFDLFTKLQRIESWENIPLKLRWLTIDSVKVSVILRRFDQS